MTTRNFAQPPVDRRTFLGQSAAGLAVLGSTSATGAAPPALPAGLPTYPPGVSFGTRIALGLLRIDGGAVDSAVLDSPLPPEVNAYDDLPAGVLLALEVLEAGCLDWDACPHGLLEPLREVLAGLAYQTGRAHV